MNNDPITLVTPEAIVFYTVAELAAIGIGWDDGIGFDAALALEALLRDRGIDARCFPVTGDRCSILGVDEPGVAAARMPARTEVS